jgi:hypothetical protein
MNSTNPIILAIWFIPAFVVGLNILIAHLKGRVAFPWIRFATYYKSRDAEKKKYYLTLFLNYVLFVVLVWAAWDMTMSSSM